MNSTFTPPGWLELAAIMVMVRAAILIEVVVDATGPVGLLGVRVDHGAAISPPLTLPLPLLVGAGDRHPIAELRELGVGRVEVGILAEVVHLRQTVLGRPVGTPCPLIHSLKIAVLLAPSLKVAMVLVLLTVLSQLLAT